MMTQEELLLEEIKEFKLSKEREWMLTGDRYYKVENDIHNRKMYRVKADGSKEEDKAKANNKLAHGFINNQVDEKVSYLLTKDYTLQCDNDKYIKKINHTLGKYFQYTLTTLGTDASNKGIAWLHPYISEKGKFKTLVVPAEQGIPLWKDNEHRELDGFIRFYNVTAYEGKKKKTITKVEYYTATEVHFYLINDQKLIRDIERYEGGPIKHYIRGEQHKSWGKVPFIAFKNNRLEYPDIRFIKTLVDGYDTSRSDVSNFIEEVKNLIFVLKGYAGQDLSEFMQDLNYFRAILVDEDEHAGVDVLNPKMDIESAKQHFEQLKRDIKEFGQSVNKDLDKFGSAPSGIALKFLYSGLDLKCNHLEVEFRRAFEDLLTFVNIYLFETNQGTHKDDVTLIFNRDVKINEQEKINDCVNSKDIISDESIITQHPWVDSVEEELKRLKKQREEKAKEASKAFGSYDFKQNPEQN